jgi:hypothetical protein
MKRWITGLALLPCLCPAAQAQIHSIDQTARFALKPAVRLTALRAGDMPVPRSTPRGFTDAPPGRDEAAIAISVARQTLQFSQQRASGLIAAMPLASHVSRTRIRTVQIESLLPVDNRTSLRLGWSGAKYSNRNANVTAAYSNANLRAKDWFQPHAALLWSARDDLLLQASYDETMFAYADVGMSGPLGLAREDFRRLQAALRPERHRRMRVGAEWTATPGLRLGLDFFGGRLDDRMLFADGGALPANRGSADVQGGAIMATQRLTPTISCSLRYALARIDRLGGDAAQEQQVAAEGRWQAGPWRASLRAAHVSAPALLLPGEDGGRSLRLSAAIAYEPPVTPGLTIGLRLADPDRLASSSFSATAAPVGLRAQDQARSLLLSASLAL